MSDGQDTYREPKVSINRVYTRKGDQGTTYLVGGQQVDKSDIRIDCYGTVDELNAVIGMARAKVLSTPDGSVLGDFDTVLLRVQHELFNAGSILATLPEDIRPNQPRVTDDDVSALESDIDKRNEDLEPLRSFVLPGGSELEAVLHLARTVCRRAERSVVRLGYEQEEVASCLRYLNRLSDALFVWSRWVNAKLGRAEVLWQPNKAASAT